MNVLQTWFKPPTAIAAVAPLSYLVGPFANELRETLRKHGVLITSIEKQDNGTELMDWGSTYRLVGQTLHGQCGFQCSRDERPISCCGSGSGGCLWCSSCLEQGAEFWFYVQGALPAGSS